NLISDLSHFFTQFKVNVHRPTVNYACIKTVPRFRSDISDFSHRFRGPREKLINPGILLWSCRFPADLHISAYNITFALFDNKYSASTNEFPYVLKKSTLKPCHLHFYSHIVLLKTVFFLLWELN
ncbi:hypothetical protein GOODEAATRI_004911, partial [Goodea atripinnis]